MGKTPANINHSFFSAIDTEEKAWCLGIMASDGYMFKSPNYNSSRVCLSMTDLDVVEKFKKCVGYEGNITLLPKKESRYKQSYVLRMTSERMFNDLVNRGITERKSLFIEYPSVCEHLNKHLIRGIFDGDGSIIATDKHNQIAIVGSKNVIYSISGLLTVNNIGNSVRRKERSEYTYVLQISWITQVKKFYEYVYSDSTIWMDRKKEKFDKLFAN